MTGPGVVLKMSAAGSEGAKPAAKYANLGDGVSGVRLA